MEAYNMWSHAVYRSCTLAPGVALLAGINMFGLNSGRFPICSPIHQEVHL